VTKVAFTSLLAGAGVSLCEGSTVSTFDKGVSFWLDFSIGPVGSFTVAGYFTMAGGNFVSVRGESGSGIEELERNIHAVIAKIANRMYRTGLPNPDDMAAGSLGMHRTDCRRVQEDLSSVTQRLPEIERRTNWERSNPDQR